MPIIQWNQTALARHMKRHRITNANQLHEFTGLTVPTAYNVLRGGELKRIETATLLTLTRAFKCPRWTLLEWIDD